MNQYMYLFHSDPAEITRMSPSEMQVFLAEWARWMQELGRQGALVAGEQLGPSSKVVRGRGKLVSDGPYSEAKETIGGYVIVRAESAERAVELARDCPVLAGGGDVEIRPVMDR